MSGTHNRFIDAANKTRVAPGGKKEPPVVEPKQTAKEEEVITEPKVVETKPVVDNPLEGMIEQKQNGKACGFYLSVEAIEKLEKLAKQNKCSKSKALDTLLRNL